MLLLRFSHKVAKRNIWKAPGSQVPEFWLECTLESRGIPREFYFSRQRSSYVRTRGGCSSRPEVEPSDLIVNVKRIRRVEEEKFIDTWPDPPPTFLLER